MGWNSWNHFSCNIDEKVIKETADALVTTGLYKLGYNYVNIDDCWVEIARDNKGSLVPKKSTFPYGIKQGQYSREHGKPTIVLEALASHDIWIWHAIFGPLVTCKDINVPDRSPIFDDILEGRAPAVNYVVNGRQYHMAYYLTDGIYPK